MKATAKDLRFRTAEIIAALDRGEEIVLTYRGEEKGRIIPGGKKSKVTNRDEVQLFGIWRTNKKVADVNAFLDDLRGGRLDAR